MEAPYPIWEGGAHLWAIFVIDTPDVDAPPTPTDKEEVIPIPLVFDEEYDVPISYITGKLFISSEPQTEHE